MQVPEPRSIPDTQRGTNVNLAPFRIGGSAATCRHANRCDRPRSLHAGAFSVAQVELLKTFAEQAVIAIGSAETYRTLQTRTADLQEVAGIPDRD